MAQQQCQLWMGSLQPYMDESFIIAAFQRMGENPVTVKLMKNKYSGDAAGYCFVSFDTDDIAINAMHKLNGKPIPGTNPVIRFKLNSAMTSHNKQFMAEREFSLWVGDLSVDVDDYKLYRAFSNKYQSIKAAKVIMDNSGFSRGYGFVKFGLEEEQKNALYEMNGYVGLGTKPLKICSAVPKPRDGMSGGHQQQQSATSIVQQAYDNYSQYYNQYNQQPQYYGQQSYVPQQPQQAYGYDAQQQGHVYGYSPQQMDPSAYHKQN